MTKFFNTFKKHCFWPISPIFGAKNILLENPALSRTTSCRILASRQNLEKTTDTIPRKWPDRQNNRWKDRQTLFHRTLLTNAGGPKTLGLPCWTWVNFMTYWIWTWKILRPPYWIWIDFTIYLTWPWKFIGLPHWIWIGFMIYWIWTWKTLGVPYKTWIDFIKH